VWFFASAVLAQEDAAAEGASTVAPESGAEAVRRTKRAQIENELAGVTEDAASTTRLWPVLTLATGVAAIAVGATGGAVEALACDGSCRTAAWQGPTILAGAAVATLGILWLRWTQADLDELDSRRYRLERERDQLDARGRGMHLAVGAGRSALALSVRGRF
jgi:hypothetical protein